MPRVIEVSVVPGSQLPANRAEAVRNFVLRLARRLGREPTASEFLEAARPERSAVHDLFEWDDAVAAEAHRLSQARKILRSIRVTIEDQGQRNTTRAFFPVRVINGSKEKGYMPTERILRSQTTTQVLMDQALRDLRAWYHRYITLANTAQMAGVFQALRVILPDLGGGSPEEPSEGSSSSR